MVAGRLKAGTKNTDTGKYLLCYQNGGKPYWGSLSQLNERRKKSLDYNRNRRERLGKDEINARNRKYLKENPEKAKRYSKSKWERCTGITRPRARMRSRIHHAIKAFDSKWNWSSTEGLIGCDFSFLRQYIESKFLPGMSWENRNEWHIDHKIPVAFAGTPELLAELFHYTNLQPLWAKDNLKKGRHFMITGKIDVTKIDKSKLFQGAKGKYLDVVFIETPNSQYGDYMIVQSVTKEERLAGVKGNILGNAKIIGARQTPAAAHNEPSAAISSPPAPGEDDLGF